MTDCGHRLVVDHLGPVVHADVALAPLTIFIGRNNTGKTYIAQALYACRQAVHSVAPPLPDRLGADELDDMSSLLAALRRTPTPDGPATPPLPVKLHEYLASKLTSGLAHAGRDLGNRLQATFGVDDLAQISSWNNGGDVRLELRRSQGSLPDVCLYGSGGTSLPMGAALADLGIDWDELRAFAPPPSLFEPDHLRREANQDLFEAFLWALLNEYWAALLDALDLDGRIHYLPAGRSAC